MKLEKTETYYILKHESGKYFRSSLSVISPLSYLTDNALEATKYLLKQTAETTIAINRILNLEPKTKTEEMLVDILNHCEIKKLTLKYEGELED